MLNKEDKLLFLCLLSPGFYICKSIFEKDHNSLTHICQAVALLGPHFTMQSTMHIDLQGTVQDLPFWKVSRCSKLKGCILLYHVCYRIHYGKKKFALFSYLSCRMTFVCCCLVVQSCPAFCSATVCRPPGSSVHGVFQARILG